MVWLFAGFCVLGFRGESVGAGAFESGPHLGVSRAFVPGLLSWELWTCGAAFELGGLLGSACKRRRL